MDTAAARKISDNSSTLVFPWDVDGFKLHEFKMSHTCAVFALALQARHK